MHKTDFRQTNGQMDGWMGEWMDGWMDGWTNRRTDGRMDGEMDRGTGERTVGEYVDGWLDGWSALAIPHKVVVSPDSPCEASCSIWVKPSLTYCGHKGLDLSKS